MKKITKQLVLHRSFAVYVQQKNIFAIEQIVRENNIGFRRPEFVPGGAFVTSGWGSCAGRSPRRRVHGACGVRDGSPGHFMGSHTPHTSVNYNTKRTIQKGSMARRVCDGLPRPLHELPVQYRAIPGARGSVTGSLDHFVSYDTPPETTTAQKVKTFWDSFFPRSL